MTATTAQVKEAFRNRRPLATTNLISTGVSLFSYGHHEIARWIEQPCPHGCPNNAFDACERRGLKETCCSECCPASGGPASKLVIRRNPLRGRSGKTSGYSKSGPWYSMTTAHHASGVYAPPPLKTEYATTETPYTEGKMRL